MNTSKAEIKNHLHKLIVETDDETFSARYKLILPHLKAKTLIGGTLFLTRKKKQLTLVCSNLKTVKGYHMKK
ncbi:MAG: hypothetical protein ACOC2M_03870 [bacterium]